MSDEKEELETLDVTINFFEEHMRLEPGRQFTALKPRVEVLKRLYQRIQQQPEIDDEDLADSIQWYLDDENIKIDIKPLTRAVKKALKGEKDDESK